MSDPFDLDRFELVNRRFDHAVGDSLLRLIGSRLQRQLREIDTLVRRSADRFTLIVENLSRPQQARLAANRLLAAVAMPVAAARSGPRASEVAASVTGSTTAPAAAASLYFS